MKKFSTIFANICPRTLFPLAAIAVALTFSACQNPQVKNEQNSNPPVKAWDFPEDAEAKKYLQSCEVEYQRVANRFAALIRPKTTLSDAELLDYINQMDIIIDAEMSKAGLYSSVHPNKELRLSAESCEQHFVELGTEMSLSRPLYDLINKVDVQKLKTDDKRYVEHMLRDYHRSGVDKDEVTRNRIKALSEAINLTGQQFDKNYREGGKTIEVNSVA